MHYFMLTPAEELGLHGVRLAGLTRSAFLGAPENELLQLMDRIREEARQRSPVGSPAWSVGPRRTRPNPR